MPSEKSTSLSKWGRAKDRAQGYWGCTEVGLSWVKWDLGHCSSFLFPGSTPLSINLLEQWYCVVFQYIHL